jgi:hypothetical protein
MIQFGLGTRGTTLIIGLTVVLAHETPEEMLGGKSRRVAAQSIVR